MQTLNNEQAAKKIAGLAVQYKENLENKNLLFVFSNGSKNSIIETEFRARHFLHLTGVLPMKSQASADFYRAALSGELTGNDFTVPNRHIASMKLEALSQTIRIHSNAQMIGDYNGVMGVNLKTEEVAGTTYSCLGFVQDKRSGFYVPNTNLLEDVRNLTDGAATIVATFRKDVRTEMYAELTHIGKNENVFKLSELPEISGKVDFNNLTATFNLDKQREEAGYFVSTPETIMHIDREVGGTFTLTVGEDSVRYDMADKQAALEKMSDDWGLEPQEAEDIFEQAESQDAIQNTLDKLEDIPKENVLPVAQNEIEMETPDKTR